MLLKTGISKKLASDGAWSFAGQAVSIISGLVTVRIVSTWIDSSAYGQVSLLLGIVALLTGLFVGPLMVVHLRLYFDYLQKGKGHWFRRRFDNYIIGISAVAVAAYLIIGLIYAVRGESHYLDYALPVIVILIAQPFLSAASNYLEAHREQRRLAFLNVCQRSIYPLFVLLLLPTHLSDANILIVSQAITVVFLLLVFATGIGATSPGQAGLAGDGESRSLFGAITAFGWGIPISYFVMWIVTTSDRFFLQYFTSLENVGLYAMNYGFWSMPYLFLNGWLEGLTRPLIYEAAASRNWPRLKRVLRWRVAVGLGLSIVGTVALFFVAEPIGKFMLGANYWLGPELVMTIALGHCLYVLGYSIMPAFLATKRSSWILVATSGAAISNVVLNLWAIPRFGLIGAAAATLISYAVLSAILASAFRKLVKELPAMGTAA